MKKEVHVYIYTYVLLLMIKFRQKFYQNNFILGKP
jgi:hypothetical protein